MDGCCAHSEEQWMDAGFVVALRGGGACIACRRGDRVRVRNGVRLVDAWRGNCPR